MDNNNMCACGEQLAMGTVPKQEWCEPYELSTALAEGTIFPCLNLTFFKAPEGSAKLPECCYSASLDPKQHNRETLMSRIMTVSFAINDLTLYLDTHPDCPNGLELFFNLTKERLQLLAEYAGNFNPLTQSSMVTGNCCENEYGWGEGPMPWEGACI